MMNCQQYKFSDLHLGLTHEFTVTVTEQMQNSFRKLTGDINPLHRDEEFAKANGFLGKVVFGMLTASFCSTMAGVYIPGTHCLLHSVESKFLKPVYIGDTLTVTGKIEELNDTFQMIKIKVEVKNQNGVKVSKSVIKAGCLNE